MVANSVSRSNVYQHKFRVPALDPKSVPRRLIQRQLDASPEVQCVIIQAPAGHGKTTLLRQIADASLQAGALSAWLTLDEADNDLYCLLDHLDQMISSIEAQIEVEPEAEQVTRSVPNRWGDRFKNRLQELNTETHLFFDEFQNIEEAEIEELFKAVLHGLPKNIKLFIASRSIPNLGISELQVREQLKLLRYDDLKFSLEETRQFFDHPQAVSLNEKEVQTIHSRAEGWPAALQLFRLSLAKRPIKESLNSLESYTPFQITEYLTSNVLKSQPANIQHFLLKCSFLTRLNPELCTAVTGFEDSGEILLMLEQQGLFLNNIDQQMYWFQFHGLFANYLKNLQTRNNAKLSEETHTKAAQWFFDQEIYDECLYHSIEAKNFTLATKAMDIWASEQIANACLHSVERWASKIPIEAIKSRPSLAVKITWALTFLRRRTKVLPYLTLLKELTESELNSQFKVERQITMAVVEMSLDHLDSVFSYVEDINTDNHLATDFWAFELGAAANIQAFRQIANGNFSAARYHVAVGRSYSSVGSMPFLAGYNTGLTIISSYLQGRVEDAYDRSLQTLKTKGLDIEESFAAVAAVCCTLFPLYERNDTETAIKVFSQYRQEIDTGLLPDFVAAAYLPMIRIYQSRGEFSEADNLLESLESLGIQANWNRLLSTCAWEYVRQAILRGDIQFAVKLAQDQPAKEAANYLTFTDAIEDPTLSSLRLRVHTAKDEQLTAELRVEIIKARDHNRIAREVKLRILSAINTKRQGSVNQALNEVKVALNLALDYGFIRTIVDEGPDVLSLLRHGVTQAWPNNLIKYTEDLLASVNNSSSAVIEVQNDFKELTSREMQILSLLAKGETNKAIARQLFVSENTVKFHLKNIFAKFGAKTRTQAISNATNAGLI